MARLEIGEVLRTAGICGVEVQIVLGIVPWNVAARDQIGEGITRCPGEFAGFAKGQYALSVEGDGKFAAKARFNLGVREPQAGCHGFGDVETENHGVPAYCLDSTLLCAEMTVLSRGSVHQASSAGTRRAGTLACSQRKIRAGIR